MEQTSSRVVYENAWMSVREDGVRRPDGTEGIYGVIDKPRYALVIAARGSQLHLVEQFRYPVGRRSWEFVQGTAPDRMETDAEELAGRELAEETGLRAARMVRIGSLHVAPGLSSQQGAVFLATQLTAGPVDRELEEQDMRSDWWERADVEAAILDGTITDAQTIAAYTQLLLHERRDG